MIDRATVDKIIEAANIVEVVGEFVSLRKAGVNYKGLCPFHDDKTPSFMVSPSKNICHCFACGKGGTPVGFIMEHEQMTYPEALRWLARKYNIDIKERELTDEERQQESERESMFIVNEWASNYFHDILLNNVDGRAIGMQYFRSRGIRDDIIEKFQLGYALQSRTALSTAALQAGYKAEFLLKTGLCYERKDERGETREGGSGDPQLVDRYSGRVIFPWLNVSGKVVAFGGRLLDQRTKGVAQKYVNSPDSDIYHKEQQLYGLYQAKRQIAKDDCVYMVEGYTDVIAMHQCGLENVVANSGTALSVHQVKMLRRFTQNIVLLYDGDEAGIHAAMRGTDMLLAEGMNVKVLILPDGDDPDSFARKHTAAEFRQYILDHQTDFIQFKSDVLLRGVTDPIKRSEAINSIVQSISVITDPIVRDTYVTDCAHRLGIKEDTLITQLNNFIRKAQNTPADQRQQQPNTSQEGAKSPTALTPLTLSGIDRQQPSSAVETMIVQMVVRHGGEVILRNVETDDGQVIPQLTVAQFVDASLAADNLSLSKPLYNEILHEAAQQCQQLPENTSFDSEAFFTRHENVDISQLAAHLCVDHFQLSKSLQPRRDSDTLREQTVRLLTDFRLDYVDAQMRQVQDSISETPADSPLMGSLLEQYSELQRMRNALAKQLGNNIVL